MTGTLHVRVSEEERRKILDETLFGMLADGDRVLSRLPDRAVLVTGKPVNHLINLVVSFLCWLWAPVWLVLWLFGGERTVTVEVDEYGDVHSGLQRMSVPKMLTAAVLVIVWLAAVAGLVWVLFWARENAW